MRSAKVVGMEEVLVVVKEGGIRARAGRVVVMRVAAWGVEMVVAKVVVARVVARVVVARVVVKVVDSG